MKGYLHAYVFPILLGCFLASAPSTESNLEDFRIITFEEFEGMMTEPSEKIRVFNFWATWCAPCVKEMPYFESVAADNGDLELVFISMDDSRNPERVTSFMGKRGIQNPVYLLNDVDYDKWINKVSPKWSGAIPATLFIKPNGEKVFHEGEVSEEELLSLISSL
ncbi:TlpA family protein disulfide reductase [Belliella marina]|uniref:TlpA family protein disulfide reductase n=1 Tax=Belliella marina TaxID=1644146 RepID=A0ABW4VKM1_9BACT